MFGPPELASAAWNEGVRVSYDRIPPELLSFEHIHVNPIAKDVLLRRDRDLLQLDTIRYMSSMSVPRGVGEYALYVSPGFGRAVPLMYREIPYHKTIGGLVMAKGCFVSGDWWKKWQNGSEKMPNTGDPMGLFGLKEAMWEIEASNMLMAAGYRTALPYAYAILSPGVKDWLKQKSGNARAAQLVEQSFGRVEQNGDVPVLLFRITGTAERYMPHDSSLSSPKRQREDVSRDSRILLEELRYEHTLMSDYIRYLDPETQLSVIDALQLLSMGRSISMNEFTAYTQLLMIHHCVNRNAAAIVLKQFRQMNTDYTLAPTVFVPSDVSLTHDRMDFELAQVQKNFRINDVHAFRKYNEIAMSHVHKFAFGNNVYVGGIESLIERYRHSPYPTGLLSYIDPEDFIDASKALQEGYLQDQYSYAAQLVGGSVLDD